MALKQRIVEDLLYGGLSKEDFQKIREPVMEQNRHSLVTWSAVASIFWIFCLFMSLSSWDYYRCRLVYTLALIICYITMFLAAFPAVRFKKMRFPLLIIFELAFLGTSLGIAVCQPDVRSITMFVAVIIIPICFIERSMLTLILLTVNFAAYNLLGYRMIDHDIFMWGLWNLLIFSVAGFLIGLVINRSRLERYIYVKSFRSLADMQIAKEAADRASAAKSDFLANMSHEIRTPINAMLGMNEMILKESLQAVKSRRLSPEADQKSFVRIHDYSTTIDNAGHSLLSIVNDILDFSRIESGKMMIVDKPYTLSSILADIYAMFILRASDKALGFTIHLDSSLPDNLYGDEVRIRQVMNNLLSNAFKYTQKGSVTLSVGQITPPEGADSGTVILEISVRDTGSGIRREDLDKLFNKFERINLDQNSTIQGAGLGLAITRSLLEKMGGEIRVESVFGKGSVFHAILPQKIVSDEPVGELRDLLQRNRHIPETRQLSFRAPDARILVVDDTSVNLVVTAGLLEGTEIRVDTATGGSEAIRLAGTNAYDLILMDQRMPGMDGVESMNRIRALGGPNSGVPFICLTADAIVGAREHYLNKGFTDYLSKPVNGASLEQMILKYLPNDKILPVLPPPDEDAETGGLPLSPFPDSGLSALQKAGLDTDSGMRYCQGKPALYRALLCEYALDSDEKMKNLARCFEAQNWKDYTVYVHAVKSSSKLIGAEDLSAKAAGLEKAAKENDSAAVAVGHAPMMAEYARVTEAIQASGFRTDPQADGDEPDIMDFPAQH